MRIAPRRLVILVAALCTAMVALGTTGASHSLASTPHRSARVELVARGAIWHQSCKHCKRRLGPGHTKRLTIPWRAKAALTISLRRGDHAIAGAGLAIYRKVAGARHRVGVALVKTNRQGKARIRLYGPDATWTIVYGKHTTALRVGQHAYIGFHASGLRGGHRATFHGFVEGGAIPAEGLVVQLSENTGSGWQTFGRLARVSHRKHTWSVSMKIPADARGYTYRLRAAVLSQPDWPWLSTNSRVLRRKVA